ncbi:hypothetical protein TRIATDRAFT_198926 [Trichoderma atroviride IMI 206040]|uniref:NACHT domain-containing protein n=1 Tax=Hypocrea atroviridis (strain ATCC 20476 / IMI 206040) TaxID=452589 RepID=G9NVY0_HYPAI|nr:uncharacterized protein TRIATDRAFT_198926 [Trichoderma atroviride IMI 206040]EHK45148.1 hypothetical protein TRIATDRAFT_198926 [Trichoderma atroviride IMI 206040]
MCPEADRTMRDAFEDLKRILTIPDRMQLENLTLEDVERAALKVEKQLAASQSLRNMRRLAPLFRGLEHYSHTIEVLCNGTPYLPWIWAPIKLVLEVSADYIKAFESMIQVYHRLAEPLARFSIFDRAFSSNKEVQKALAVYYSDILKFHGEAYKFIRRNAWQRLFATSWGRFQRRFDNIFVDLKAHEDLIDKTANAANISEAKSMREKLETWREQEAIKFKREEEEQTSIEFQAVLNFLKMDETHQIKIADNLAAEADQNPGSGHWILQQPKSRSWAKCNHDTQFVVLHGPVGSGKSILATQIGTFLRSSNYLVTTHYCTYVYPESTEYNNIILSLMIQIMRLDPELITLSYNCFLVDKKTPNRSVLDQHLRLLVETLGSSTTQSKTLHIVIDGLNECDENIAANVARTLEKLITTASSSGSTIIKVLLCTQMTPAITKAVKRKHQVSLSNEKGKVSEVIRDFTLRRISAIQPQRAQFRITDDDAAAIASRITQKADGMFLWARLVIEYMKGNMFYNRDEFLEAAHSFPRELSEIFGRLLSQILAGLDERSVRRLGSVLNWIAFAKRPLRSPELLSALAFDAGDEQVIEPVPAYILDISALSITASESLKRHGLATVRCLLASQKIFAPSYSETDRVLTVLHGVFGFHMYATEFWIGYILEHLEFDQDLLFKSDFFLLSCRLAEQLETRLEPNEVAVGNGPPNSRLNTLRQKHEPLYNTIQTVLLERGRKILEDHDIIDNNTQTGGITLLKERYQATIRELLSFSTYPSVNFHELERFKQDFRTSAYTCRIWSCRYAVFGFNSPKGIILHEADHRKQICHYPNCEYPVFSSTKSLRDHEKKYHVQSSQIIPRKSIKKHTRPDASASTASPPVPLQESLVVDDLSWEEFLNDGYDSAEDFVSPREYQGYVEE